MVMCGKERGFIRPLTRQDPASRGAGRSSEAGPAASITVVQNFLSRRLSSICTLERGPPDSQRERLSG